MSALQELQNFTFISKYARWIAAEQRRETWKEAVSRVRNMMLDKYSDYNIADEINWAYDLMEQKRVLGSQRALQYGGKPCLDKNLRIYNCLASYCDRPKFFQETLYSLLCGCGVGFSVQYRHVNLLPKLKHSNKSPCTFSIPDTIEGWADALGLLVRSYFDVDVQPVRFDYSQIRPKGTWLSSGVGTAPGPEGLRIALTNIDQLLQRCLDNNQERLRPIDAYDIVMHSSDAVLSGGVRRSSAIAMFSANDQEMAEAKTGNWLATNPQRARSNNAVMLLRNKVTAEQFRDIIQHTKAYGEPGFYFCDNLDIVANPCVEATFYPRTETGISGFQGCNLSTINCSKLKTETDFYTACKAAAIIGTLQAGFTHFPYLGEASEQIFRREALIGVSMTGMMEKHEIILDPQIQRAGARLVKNTNKQIAEAIGIRQAARTTLLKPEGTASALLGTSSGIHPHHAKRYIRHVQVNKTEQPYQLFKRKNPDACEKSVWASHNTDDVIKFPIEVPDGSKIKNQLPALQFLQIVKDTQKNWVMSGRNSDLCVVPELEYNVSNTIRVQDDEWESVTKFIYKNRKYFTGIALLSATGDKDYNQAPFTEVLTSHEIVRKYGDGAIWCSGIIELALQAFKNLWAACDALLDTNYNHATVESINGNRNGDRLSNVLKQISARIEFWERSQKFAHKYFNDDIRQLTYCLKDVYNWKSYFDLSKTFMSVDYTQLVECEDNTKLEEEIACSGGTCELIKM